VSGAQRALERVAARVALDLAGDEELPAGAVAALEAGRDTDALRLLAAGAEDGPAARALLAAALDELGIAAPSAREAALLLARGEAAAIVSGARAPQDAAERIWDLVVRADPERLPELDPFVYAASEWRDRPEDGALFTAAVRAAAARLLAG
jgi:hypothetical protein